MESSNDRHLSCTHLFLFIYIAQRTHKQTTLILPILSKNSRTK
ncbi:hypothetical protein V6Z12_D06G190600 [Gossypium hirsutum]|uniref:Uncharacterized protein n=1 Tax=Gossypium tomentosum TaxID=34277 RepID=A0A5D2KM11_GOSTO|nr:hypothetical protein ES332_D06G208200v1 [Gossypium tomentosum]